MQRLSIAFLVLGLFAVSSAAQMPKYGVTVKADNKVDFTKFKSYAWETGWKSFDKNVHQQILDAVDRELKGLGFEKRASAPADVMLTYATVRRTDVDLKSKPTENEAGRRQYDVGSLVVLMLEPGTRKELFRARVDKPIEADPDKLQAVIDEAVAEMFAKYPTRTRK
jgi:uncharacterized protein DUF4136